MPSFNFLIVQTTHCYKSITVDGDTVSDAQASIEDTFGSVDISNDDGVRTEMHTKVKYLKAIDLKGTSAEDSKKYYVVWVGHTPGVYETWEQCKAQTHGFRKSQFKAFIGKATAQAAFESGPEITMPPPCPINTVVEEVNEKGTGRSAFFDLHPEERPGDGPADDEESPFYD